eukprot:CAMPEP_0176358090 /NCGR_PEP_ID=MMETSP0126-20121128/15284_1 /TAXON_ID=141414 ORGANISM="Strombidinopsis acuminatum, Strain SPMC142" /NCGR_SAMPLE_ID=MMETSP0126 /ASSEMBLY_ACC=CAM_ASM_000229 /LENGTH=144 /DNA_ID=CAMNT_0017712067 /DNA_START=38 /DNA_END=472 /DNA_ORIENTATION=-
MNIERTLQFLNQTEGRDKFCKMIQYLSRILKYWFEGNNESLFIAFKGLMENMSVSRKLFRLFKSFNEYIKIKGFLKDPNLTGIKQSLSILSRLAFLFYWLFDNISVLIKVKFFHGLELKPNVRRASKFWLLGIFLSIVLIFVNL